jgi:hypothetical protein
MGLVDKCNDEIYTTNEDHNKGARTGDGDVSWNTGVNLFFIIVFIIYLELDWFIGWRWKGGRCGRWWRWHNTIAASKANVSGLCVWLREFYVSHKMFISLFVGGIRWTWQNASNIGSFAYGTIEFDNDIVSGLL